MKRKYLWWMFASGLLLFCLTGCGTTGGAVVIENPDGRVIIEDRPDAPYREEPAYYPRERIKIPKGHMPPPGQCRIWYPDRPPGHQPSPRRI